jgi:hypothetical protein
VETEENPRGTTGALRRTTTTKSTDSITRDPDLAADLRRRRAASYRMPLLPCGHRDPLDCLCAHAPVDLDASRKAWRHLADMRLLDDEGWLAALLAEAGGVG